MNRVPRPLLAVAGVLLLAVAAGCYFTRGTLEPQVLRFGLTALGYLTLAGAAWTLASAIWPRREEDEPAP